MINVFPVSVITINGKTLVFTGDYFYNEQEVSVEDTNWEQVVDNGFGNRNNVYAWSMKAYKGYLYVGTLNYVDGCQVYRSKTGDIGTWKQVNKNGFGNDNQGEVVYKRGARNMIVYKNLLWVATSNRETGTQIWITNGEDDDEDGILNWKQANENGFGDGTEVFSSRAMVIFRDKLYIGSRTEDKGARIYKYDGPTEFENITPDNWTCVNKDWLNNPNHNPLLCIPGRIINFTTDDGKDYLYVGVYNTLITPYLSLLENFSIKMLLRTIKAILIKCEIWRYDGTVWEEIVDKGFNRADNLELLAAVVLNNSLYFGTASKFGGKLWKTSDGKNWTNVIRFGFGKLSNNAIWEMHVHNNKLIVGTFNPLLGCQVWASNNDNPNKKSDFKQINKNGMDGERICLLKAEQYGIRAIETFNDELYVGTNTWLTSKEGTPSYGCEVWRIDHLPDDLGENH